jgi:hypothetical protein
MPLLSPHTHYMHQPLSLLDFITRTILGEEYRSLSSSLCSTFIEILKSNNLEYFILKYRAFHSALQDYKNL